MTEDSPGTAQTATDFSSLKEAKYISLTTFRKTGVAVPTPVWFAQRGETLYIVTDSTSGKVKRLRNNPKVTIASCTARGQVTGPKIEAQARIVAKPDEEQTAGNSINKKYGVQKRVFDFLMNITRIVRRRPSTGRVYLAVEKV